MATRKRLNTPQKVDEVLGFRAEFDVYHENLGGADPDDEWTRDSHSSSWTFRRLVRDDSYPDLTISAALASSCEDFWYVFVIYSGGDSFGHDHCAYKTDVGLYADREMADAVAKAIREHSEAYRRYERYDAKEKPPKGWNAYSLTLPDGQTICASWNGYFDSLDYIEVVKVDLGASKYPNRY